MLRSVFLHSSAHSKLSWLFFPAAFFHVEFRVILSTFVKSTMEIFIEIILGL